MPEPVINSALAQAPEHARKKAAHKQQAGNASTHHHQRHNGAPAIAEHVPKG
jgi:hypothetical protein